MNKLPRTFCVTLRDTPLRTNSFLQSAKEAGIEPELFYGVLGRRLGLNTKFPNLLESSKGDIFMTEGALGCMLSHFILWKTLQYQPEEEFFVVEDDALFDGNFKEKFQELYSSLPPDWEFVYVGWIPYGNDTTPVVVNKGISIRLPSATHAYLVKRSILDKLCGMLLPFQSPIDLTMIVKILPTIKYYVFDPPIVSQKSFLNAKDSIWTSMVYDWKADLYGVKRKLLRSLSLNEGWYSLERDRDTFWRWSMDKFTINVPSQINRVTILCSSPIDNLVSFHINDKKENFQIKSGDNEISLMVSGTSSLIGIVPSPYIPSNNDTTSSDNRSLGICLKRITLEMEGNDIQVGVEEL